MTTLESDVKRLVANAKSYNEKTSELFADAERIRKMCCNFMTRHNPAYKDPKYVAFPTPLPEEAEASETPSTVEKSLKIKPLQMTSSEVKAREAKLGKKAMSPVDADGDATMDDTAGRKGTRSTRKPSAARAASVSLTNGKEKQPTPAGDDGTSPFAGKSFQIAQEQIISELITLKDEE